MPYPAALGERALTAPEAYDSLAEYARQYGREPLLLLLHAAVPETLRPELLNLIRLNFLPGRGALGEQDTSLEADVLFSPLCSMNGHGAYRLDPQVRWHALALLRSLYRHDKRPRARRVAELLWCYVSAQEPRAQAAQDPALAEYLAVQRWVALAFLAPAQAAQAFAAALQQAEAQGATGPASAAVMRLGGLASAIELPLGHEPALLAYARGLDALVGGDEQRATTLLAGLGDDELRVGPVVLKPAGQVLRERRAAHNLPPRSADTPARTAAPAATTDAYANAETEADAAQAPVDTSPAVDSAPAPRRQAVLLQPAGPQRRGARTINLDTAAVLLQDALTSLGFGCTWLPLDSARFRAHSTAWDLLLQADAVLLDLSLPTPAGLMLLGLCLGLRAGTTLVLAEQQTDTGPVSQPAWQGSAVRYALPPGGLSESAAPPRDPQQALRDELGPALTGANGQLRPGRVFTRLPSLLPPRQVPGHSTRARAPDPGRQPQCLVLQGFGRRVDPTTGRPLDLDAAYIHLQQAIQAAGLICLRADLAGDTDDDSPGLLEALLDADLVIADISTAPDNVLRRLGLRWAWRPWGTLVIAERRMPVPSFGWLSGADVMRYTGPGDDAKGALFAAELRSRLQVKIHKPKIDSPVYLALPDLQPPQRRAGPSRSSGGATRQLGEGNGNESSNAIPTEPTTAATDTLPPSPSTEPNDLPNAAEATWPTPAPPKVFISYIHEYRAHAKALCHHLRVAGMQVQSDMDLQPGDAWDPHLTQWLDEADAVLAIAGPATHKRPFPLREIGRAEALHKRLIPVLVDPMAAGEIVPALRERLWANRDAQGNVQYLGSLKGDELELAHQHTARQILEVLLQDADSRSAAGPQPAAADVPGGQASAASGEASAVGAEADIAGAEAGAGAGAEAETQGERPTKVAVEPEAAAQVQAEAEVEIGAETALAPEVKADQGAPLALKASLAPEVPRTVRWWQAGAAASRAVGKLRQRLGAVWGTGFLVRAGDFGLTPPDEPLLLTCRHMLGPPDESEASHSLTPDQAEVVFEADDPARAYAFSELLWASPTSQHDASLLRLAQPPIHIAPLHLAHQLPPAQAAGQRGASVVLIGHPDGRELAFSVDGNHLLDHEGPPDGLPQVPGVWRVHYRASTETGSSGSPVFNADDWTVIALHHARSDALPRLNGHPGRYAAAEGLALPAIVAAAKAALGDPLVA